MKKGFFRRFIQMEASGGILLMAAALLALIAANGPFSGLYESAVSLSRHTVNDGLMALFFLMIGVEVKRELAAGTLSTAKGALLPVLAALGGMIVPAILYTAVNAGNSETMAGWAIPCATDIAFALCILTLAGPRVPVSLKILLTAIAVMDDLGAIALIALFYTDTLAILPLCLALVPLAALGLLNVKRVQACWPYLFLGALLWMAVFQSGIHATLAGVATALFIPLPAGEKLEKMLHGWVVFGILPLFAFVNAGISYAGVDSGDILDPVPLGIILGLFAGKQIGVFGSVWIAVKTKLCPKPQGAGWLQIYALSMLCGIGFTMSFFIGTLAFSEEGLHAQMRLGVLTGSVLSAVAAYILLRTATRTVKVP